MEPFAIDSLSFFLNIIQPSFADLLPEGTMATEYTGVLNDFYLMDNVVSTRPIFSVQGRKNILQRRDAGCDLIYKQVADASGRTISTDELAAAARMCRHEIYQGALKDFRNDDPLFGTKILPFFTAAVAQDLISNSYFGDVSRVENPLAYWSTTQFDGVFKWLKKYYTAGVIPASQGITFPVVDLTANPIQAFTIIKQMYAAMPALMSARPDEQKVFYVSKAVREGYVDYLLATTGASSAGLVQYMAGVGAPTYKGIPIVVNPFWEPIMQELYGPNKHAAVLTLRKNFVFGTDKDYGEEDGSAMNEDGSVMKEALRVWYSKEKLSWYYQMFLKAGTQIALPQMIVFAVPA